MPEREITPTHSALLELKDERAGMQEGYDFLDEKLLVDATMTKTVAADHSTITLSANISPLVYDLPISIPGALRSNAASTIVRKR